MIVFGRISVDLPLLLCTQQPTFTRQQFNMYWSLYSNRRSFKLSKGELDGKEIPEVVKLLGEQRIYLVGISEKLTSPGGEVNTTGYFYAFTKLSYKCIVIGISFAPRKTVCIKVDDQDPQLITSFKKLVFQALQQKSDDDILNLSD
eukprot:TRINITY_DN7371_c0_g1_i1.p1 TRINITY_DN7371_c0_g1~~TRINITY_DN7371_c0_g1_i1.p1  ORF type:complete len:146 (-),score=18.56 TRINITY_DN7371_c0_g1_i1:20-457(-)